MEIVKSLLKNGTDINAKDTNGITALMGAAVTGQTNVLEFLLDKGADINEKNTDGSTALNCAAMGGQTDAAEFLLDKGADIGNALEKAAWNGSVQTIKLLLARGADVNAVYYGTGTALISAALAGKFEAVKFLLEKGADVNAKESTGNTALMSAAYSGQTNVVELLLDNGADINANAMFDGTALMEAAHDGNIEIVKLLLVRGADINAKNSDGQTALDVAKKNGNIAIVRLLQPINLAVASGTNTDSSGYVTNANLLTPFTITNSAGDVVTNAVLVKLTPNKFIYKADNGAEGMMPLGSLPKDLQEKFGYDPTLAAAQDDIDKIKSEIDRQNRIEASQQAIYQEKVRQTTAYIKTCEMHWMVTVIQNVPDGLLVRCPDDTTALIVDLNKETVTDDEQIECRLYPYGVYTYESVNNSEKTVRKLTPNLDHAISYKLANPN